MHGKEYTYPIACFLVLKAGGVDEHGVLRGAQGKGAQVLRLAAQLGSELRGVLYVLDEPTIGLHPQDNERLLHTLADLKQRGNTLLVVEHDEEMMRAADWIIDMGPEGGLKGGMVCAEGTPEELAKSAKTPTGEYLRKYL